MVNKDFHYNECSPPRLFSVVTLPCKKNKMLIAQLDKVRENNIIVVSNSPDMKLIWEIQHPNYGPKTKFKIVPAAILNFLPVSVKSAVPQYPDLINIHPSTSELNLMLFSLNAQLFCYAALYYHRKRNSER